MNWIRFAKQSNLFRAKPEKNANGTYPNYEHPHTFALERLYQADACLEDHDWIAAKTKYSDAVGTLEKMPLADQENLKYGLKRLAYIHLRLFEFPQALSCFLRLRRSESIYSGRSGRDQVEQESALIMARIKAARSNGKNSEPDYTPGIYTGHL